MHQNIIKYAQQLEVIFLWWYCATVDYVWRLH